MYELTETLNNIIPITLTGWILYTGLCSLVKIISFCVFHLYIYICECVDVCICVCVYVCVIVLTTWNIYRRNRKFNKRFHFGIIFVLVLNVCSLIYMCAMWFAIVNLCKDEFVKVLSTIGSHNALTRRLILLILTILCVIRFLLLVLLTSFSYRKSCK